MFWIILGIKSLSAVAGTWYSFKADKFFRIGFYEKAIYNILVAILFAILITA